MDDLFPWLSFSSPHLSFTFQNVLLILLPTCDSFSFSLSKVGRKCPSVITSKYQTPHGTKHKSSVQITCTPQANVILRRSWSVWSRWRVSPSLYFPLFQPPHRQQMPPVLTVPGSPGGPASPFSPWKREQLHLYFFFYYNGCLEMQSNPLDH